MKLTYICLGKDLEKQENSFSGQGDWTLLKCFYENSRRYGEFYFNFNKKGEAELCKKDNDYSSVLLEGLEEELSSKLVRDITPPKKELIDWNKFTDILLQLAENRDKTISRHAKGLIKEMKL